VNEDWTYVVHDNLLPLSRVAVHVERLKRVPVLLSMIYRRAVSDVRKQEERP
jgi:hypothetical protein